MGASTKPAVSQIINLRGSAMNARDYENLARSWITREFADRARLRRVDAREGGEVIGRNGAHDYAGVLFPYIWPGEDRVREYRLRLDKPDLELKPDGSTKERQKYLAPPGRGSLLYFGPGVAPDLLSDVSMPIVITEGEKKTLSLCRLATHGAADRQRFLPIGLAGVWNWKGTIGKEAGPSGERRSLSGPIPDLSRIDWKDRKVYIAFDSNVQTNPSVQAARRELARVLRKRGSQVFFVTVPILDGVNGVDDWLAVRGPEEVLAAFENASTSELAQVPSGFELDNAGLRKITEQGSKFLCSRLEVVARARNQDQENWSKLLRWSDGDGCEHRYVMPMELLVGDKTELLKRLVRGGLHIETRTAKVGDEIADYINRARPLDDVRCVQRLGWHESAYVLPDESFAPEGSETVMFYDDNPRLHFLRVAGSLGDWTASVGSRCSGNSRLVFAVSIAFGGPLLRPLNEFGGGFNLRGKSSMGKSTACIVGGSVWGAGNGRLGYCRSWKATGNGVESIAPFHNDGVLFLDELKLVDPAVAGTAAYQLANGQTTQRAKRNGGARQSEEFSLLFLSNGELSLAQHMQDGGKQIRGGQDVRMCDLPADAGKDLGSFEKLNGSENAKAFAEELVAASLRVYGSPIRAYLAGLQNSEWQGTVKHWRQEFSNCARELHGDVSSEVGRAMSRFSLVAAAGELATSMGITGWPAGEAVAAALTCFNAWLEEKGSSRPADEEAAFRQVVEFLERHGGSRFQNHHDREAVVRDRIGFRGVHRGEPEFWILPEQFEREICKGFDPKMVSTELKRRGFLRTDSDGKRNRAKVAVPAIGSERTRVYAIPARILEAEDEGEKQWDSGIKQGGK